MGDTSTVLVFFVASILFPAGSGLQLLSPALDARQNIVSPMFRFWSGPPSFSLNTSAIDAPLVDIGNIWDTFCEPLDQSSEDGALLAALVTGKVVLVSGDRLFRRCSSEYSFLNLVELEPAAIIFFVEKVSTDIPGFFFWSRGWRVSISNEAMRKTVPTVVVVKDDGLFLRSLASEDDGLPVHMLIGPDDNYWQECTQSWEWIAMQRVLVPLGYFGVFLSALSVMSGGYIWGSTKAWVLWVELIPAILFCFCSSVGALFDNSTFPAPVHAGLLSRLRLSELLTTVIVARFWRAHAIRANTNVDDIAPQDPQTKGWAPTIVSCSIVVFDVLFSCQFAMPEESRLDLLSPEAGVLMYSLLYTLVQIIAGIYLLWYCGGFLLSNTTSSNPGTQRIGAYLVLSACFIILDLVASAVAAFYFLAIHTDTCGSTLFYSFSMQVARIGTGFCQLSVFRPQKRAAYVVPIGTMDTVYLRDENRMLQLKLLSKQKETLAEKARVSTLKAKLVETLIRKNAELGLALRKLKSSNKAESIMNHNIKNILAETFSTLALYRQGKVNGADLHRTSKALKRALRFIQNSLNLAKILQDKSNTAKPVSTRPTLSTWIREHCTVCITVTGIDGQFSIREGIVAEMFLDLTLDNAVVHGTGAINVHCTYEAPLLTIDVANGILGKGKHLRPFSTGLGLADLGTICGHRDVACESAKQDNDRWHARIKLAATNILVETKAASKTDSSSAGSWLPGTIKVAVIDDQPMITLWAKMELERLIPGVTVEVYILNTSRSFDQFINYTIPDRQTSWDIVLLDQHFDMEDSSKEKLGTTILQELTARGDGKLCCIMHTGNNKRSEKATYLENGCHGMVGKGDDMVSSILDIYHSFLQTMRKP